MRTYRTFKETLIIHIKFSSLIIQVPSVKLAVECFLCRSSLRYIGALSSQSWGFKYFIRNLYCKHRDWEIGELTIREGSYWFIPRRGSVCGLQSLKGLWEGRVWPQLLILHCECPKYCWKKNGKSLESLRWVHPPLYPWTRTKSMNNLPRCVMLNVSLLHQEVLRGYVTNGTHSLSSN